MDTSRNRTQPWLRRFMERGGLTLTSALFLFPFISYAVRRTTTLDWFYTILVALLISIIASAFLTLPLAALLVFLFPAMTYEVCPACGERKLAPGIRVPSRTRHPAFTRAHCRHCRRRFHWYDDGTLTEQPQKA